MVPLWRWTARWSVTTIFWRDVIAIYLKTERIVISKNSAFWICRMYKILMFDQFGVPQNIYEFSWEFLINYLFVHRRDLIWLVSSLWNWTTLSLNCHIVTVEHRSSAGKTRQASLVILLLWRLAQKVVLLTKPLFRWWEIKVCHNEEMNI